ncbi:MAG: AAA family ATPase, partial [Acidobacteria bacterium]|nr:AAA family ATPase [Acidobacteriota bacterium]
LPIRYWRTKSGLEADFVLGREPELAIAVKGTGRVRPDDLKGIRAFTEEHHPRRSVVVSNDPAPRLAGEVEVLPWRVFLERLWGEELI